ncbi:hypothetical protein NL108_005503 [Boleophthalmus pectinirostris]|uniref:uncharacterized protein LOC110159846 n=1 Tax=Boleophthalmus pectinirostris TaxID=150288 RepID=UPI00242E9578|nr:uncharacterized protein LOC110159846 [Boleophthalmus pectinirostris]KAJ0061520.1 hypothetical protein NL108_005503 [Boleophthalmus pectinirostris]
MALRVAVIGAGAAGLCAARHLLSRPGTFLPPIVFEAGGRIGGTWAYEERVGTYDNGRAVHSSMYQNLRTNLPKEVMMFPDFPFDPKLDSFIHHEEVLRYLQQYCDYFKITPHIRFNTAVERVRPVTMETADRKLKTQWEVTSLDNAGSERTERFDSVFVCSGHYSDPHIPQIPGLQHFKGELLHSHNYRRPEPYSGKTIVILGAKASAIDISMELSSVAQKVYLSHRPPLLTFPLPPNISEVESIKKIQEDGTVMFQDGGVVRPDVLLLCTGYNFTFPFVSGAELGVRVESDFVGPLYRHLMPPSYPSIFFIGLCTQICPFPHFHCQVQYCLAVLEGAVTLPSVQQMEQESGSWLEERLRRGLPQRHLLRVEQEQWEYCRGLAQDANFSQIGDVVKSLFQEVWRQRRVHPVLYRKHNYRMISDTQWERLGTD